MKLKQLESQLGMLAVFKTPKIIHEQYPTTAHLAARMINHAAALGDISGKFICDLGVGCGALTAASIFLGAEYNVGVDIDLDALEQATQNLNLFDMQCDLIHADVTAGIDIKCDTVLMNPPFGTKNNKGIDCRFLQVAASIAPVIYSLHKSSTRDHVVKRAASFGLDAEVIAQLNYDLDSTYRFHKKKQVTIQVDFIRFIKSPFKS
jgi:predicted RNA methylase